MKRLPSVLAAVLSFVAIVACGPDGRDKNGGVDGGNTGGDGGNTGDNCSAEATFIYTVDDRNDLLKFDPATKQFSSLGQLGCQAEFAATPFSMGVDRTATAYVLYSSGELFRVDTMNPSSCTKTSWTPQHGLELYGMGFSTDTAGGSSDKLYIAGGIDPGANTQTLAVLDVGTMQSQVLGQVNGSPELTGTGSAELWGFFPGSSPRVAKLDKATGAETTPSFSLSASGEPAAWAFAFHGGDFWVFLMRQFDSSTSVYQIDGTNGQLKGTTSSGNRIIVGAGVSTCAPVIL